jgi:hypothetical protein
VTGGGARHWNEETQRWEDADAPAVPPVAPPTVPPASSPAGESLPPLPPLPARPEHLPYVPSEPTPPVPSAGGGRALWWKVVAGAVVLGVGAGYGVLKLTGDGDDGSDRTRTAATAPAGGDGAPMDADTGAGAPASESASASPSATESALPTGFREVTDPAGFSLAVPDGWKRSERDAGVFYATDGDRNLLQIFVVTEPELTPYEAVAQSSKNLGAQQPGYEEISLDRAAAPDDASPAVGDDAARLVYAYDSEKLGTRKQGVEYVFTADNGKKYAVVAAGPQDDWPTTEESARVALAHLSTDGAP